MVEKDSLVSLSAVTTVKDRTPFKQSRSHSARGRTLDVKAKGCRTGRQWEVGVVWEGPIAVVVSIHHQPCNASSCLCLPFARSTPAVTKLEQRGLGNTEFFFTSDNGYH